MRMIKQTLVLAMCLLLSIGLASANLELRQPDTNVAATFVGNGGYSADGLGARSGFNPGLQAEVPADSTVEYAFLYVVSVNSYMPATLNFNGNTVNMQLIGSTSSITSTEGNKGGVGEAAEVSTAISGARTGFADVTSIVAPVVGNGGGIYTFTIDDVSSTEGVALVVIYSNAGMPTTSIAVMDGALGSAAETTFLGLAEPLDKTVPGFTATMSLGIQFGYQGGSAEGTHICGTGSAQFSYIDVNGARLSSCAGNYDDGYGENLALITVGGVGDSTDNPSDPYQEAGDGQQPRIEDDEFYNIADFTDQGDTSISIRTENPSTDDSVFLAVFQVSAEVSQVLPEDCSNGEDDDGDGLIDIEDPDCQYCGNGALESGEECDDGNNVNGDGCTSKCLIEEVVEEEPFCGDGVWDPDIGEECDDGNNEDGDGCSANCMQEEDVGPFCGDGIVQPDIGEQCDDGNEDPYDGCTNECQWDDVGIPEFGVLGATLALVGALLAGLYIRRRR